MYYNKLIIMFGIIFICIHFGYSQTTNIPDENFEQALIDLGIDSDGIVNGQVLTADIVNVTELDLSVDSFNEPDYSDLDITGISDFTALEILNLGEQPINWNIDDENILNSNLNLREIYINKESIDVGYTIAIESLNLGNLQDLEYVDLGNVYINSIILDNPNFDYENLTLNLFTDYDLTHNFCIQVNDPVAANNNNPPYDTWTINFNDFYTSYSFTSNCTLSTDDFESFYSISLFPNPVQERLYFENPKQITINEVEIFNMEGQLVKTFSEIKNGINLVNLGRGVYFVKVKNQKTTETFKILKQ